MKQEYRPNNHHIVHPAKEVKHGSHYRRRWLADAGVPTRVRRAEMILSEDIFDPDDQLDDFEIELRALLVQFPPQERPAIEAAERNARKQQEERDKRYLEEVMNDLDRWETEDPDPPSWWEDFDPEHDDEYELV